MSCQKSLSLLKRMIKMSRKELNEHLSECSVCRLSLSEAYIAYVKRESEPVLDSFPPYRPKTTKTEFLGNWIIRLAWKREKAEWYQENLKHKMGTDSVKILTIMLIRDLFRYLEKASGGKRSFLPIKTIRSLKDIFEAEEAEIFFGFTEKSTDNLIKREKIEKDTSRPQALEVASTDSRATYYLQEVIDKMDRDEVKSLTIEIINGLMEVAIFERPDFNFEIYMTLVSAIESLNRIFCPEEIEVFFSFEKEKVFEVIEMHLTLKEEKNN